MTSRDTAQSYVTKSFLIDIITRDIGILDAILELVDNSLDRVVEIHKIDVTKSLTEEYNFASSLVLPEAITININISDDEFTIEDNCGGITRADIEKEVFVFGLPKEGLKYTGLSAFGIGMKRAFFKLGRYVKLQTWAGEKDKTVIDWNIDEWMKKRYEEKKGYEDWDIPFSDIKASELHFNYELPGTIIKIGKLNSSVKTRFGQTEFVTNLKNRLKASYALFLKSGIKLILNGEELSYALPSFFTSEEINYTSKYWKIEDVDVRIIAGITPFDDRVPRGWYVFCNGRMVLDGDKTQLTGWGTHLPLFHPKFNHFLGFVSFSSANVKILPWSSTKWGVELDSPVYMNALEEMRIQAIPILNFLDRWKDIKDDDESSVTALRELLGEGKTTSVFASAKVETNFVFTNKKERPDVTKITFIKDRELVQRVKNALGNPKMRNSSVGEMVFDYYVESELD